MSRVSFLVGFDRIAQSSAADIAGAVETDNVSKGQSRRNLGKKGEESLNDFWEETRMGLVRRMREKSEKEAATIAMGGKVGKKPLNLFVTSQIKKKVHHAKEVARKKTRLIVHPNDPRKLYWDIFVGVMIVYSMVLIPWRISFNQKASDVMVAFDYFVDCVFGVDIVLSFNSAYFEEGVLVNKRSTIANRYLYTWFVPDVLGTMPLESFTGIFINSDNSSSNLQGIKLLRGIRLLKLMRILRLSRKLAQVDFSRHFNPSILRLIKLLGKIVFAAHLLGCMWFIVDECDVEGRNQDWQTCGGASLGSKYLASLYWTIATLMSVGYGDISANNKPERLFALITMVIGSTAFGFIIAMVTVIVETMDPQATAKNAKMDEVREYMAVRKLPNALQLRMRKHFDHVYRNTSVFREAPILRDLPYALRVKLVYDTHENLLHTLSFFEDLEVPVLTEMVYRLKPMQLKRKEYMGKAGDVLDDVFFVVKGKVEARVSKPGKQVLIALHPEGSDFELSSLVLCLPMRFTYRAVVPSELMWLDKDDLETISTEHASAGDIITEKAEKQSALLEECLALEDTCDGSNYRQTKVLLDWKLVPAENIAKQEDALMSVLPDDDQPDGMEDAMPLIRTLRPISKHMESGCTPKPSPAPIFMQGYEGDAGGMFVGRGWRNDDTPGKKKSFSFSESRPDRPKRRSSLSERSAVGEEEEERKERTPAHMEEAFETAQSIMSRWVVLPNASWKQKWDTFAVILIALSVIVVPFRIGFDATPEGGWFVMDIITDLTFGVDIILNFRMAYTNGHVLVTSPGLMASHYLRGWFTIDFLSTVPFDRIMSLTMGGESSRVFRGLKLVKVVRMVRLLRLFRVLKTARFQLLTEEVLELNAVLFRGLKLVVTLALLGHFFGCFWSFVSLSEGTSGDDPSAAPSTWWESLELHRENLPGRYIASIYWAFTTMTTVGYGDIVPVVDQERAYATIIMVIGATVFGYIVGSVSALASNPNGSQARQTVQILAVSNYLVEKKVQQKLAQAVKKHVEYYLRQNTPFDEEKLQALMPPSLRQKSMLQIHKDVLSKIAIFKHLNPNQIAYMLRLMKPLFTVAGNYIYTPPHGSDGVYFLICGTAEAVREDEGLEQHASLYAVQPGNFFGHDAFLPQSEGERPQQGKISFRAVTDCSMQTLFESDILQLMDTQPDLAIQLQRAIGHAMASQELSVPIEQAPSAKGFNLYSIAAAESGMGEAVSRPFTFKGRRLSTIKGFGGAKVVPVDGGGPI